MNKFYYKASQKEPRNNLLKITEMELILPDLSYSIRGACFEVYKKLGSFHKETVYQKALALELVKRGVKFETEKDIPVIYDGQRVGSYRADFVIENSIILETKATKFNLTSFEKQLFYYLAGTNYKVGFLVNFGTDNRVYIKRWALSASLKP